MGRRITRVVSAAVFSAAVAAGAVLAATPASGAPAPGPSATEPGIHPGVMTRTDGAQCTANFIFRDGARTFIGQAAHCSGTGGATETDGCNSKSLPLGTKVQIDGASQPGTLVYNSWLAMQKAGETDPNACAYNDFALVEIADADKDKVSAAVPQIGGPTGLSRGGVAPGSQVRSYGNSELRGGITFLSPKTGVSTGTTGGGWTHSVATVTPGIPGDSGSGFLTQDGVAFGVLSTLNFLPAPGTNGVSDLAKMLDYARAHGVDDLQLVTA